MGRVPELEELWQGVADALAGSGGLWLLSGEAGIGKSRLAEEIARATDLPASSILWGRCWEAGGAPAYWPWIQILRGLVRSRSPGRVLALADRRAPYVAQLLPELRDREDGIPEPQPLGAEQARFQLLDAIAGLLCEAAASEPLVLVLEDLHAADPSSLLLLEFLADQLRTTRLVVLGTFREIDAHRARTGPILGRIAQSAQKLVLGRLARGEVAQLLECALGAPPGEALVDVVFDSTEGHPLFIVEISRFLAARAAPPEIDPDRVLEAVPPSLEQTIRDRFYTLSDTTRAALEIAAVIGRELDAGLLAEVTGQSRGALAGVIDEACAAEILTTTAPDRYRFSHGLLREILYSTIAGDRRRGVHLRLGEILEQRYAGRSRAPWSEIAHHYMAAGDAACERAIEASTRAGEQATEQLAFDEAVAFYADAMAALETTPTPEPKRRAELMIRLGGAQMRAGEIAAGQETCGSAAALARQIDAVELLARAALEYGSAFVFAQVDPRLVALLQEAQQALGDRDSGLRARVTARLAAAMQPAADPAEPIALAREAIAMARRVGDPKALLLTLRSGCSTMMDVGDAGQRIELNREHVSLAEKLREPVDALRGYTRLAFDCFELGDLTGAEEAARSAAQLAESLEHPHYGWRARAFAATGALWEGRFAAAEQLIDAAHETGTRGGDPNSRSTYLYQRLRLLRLQGRRQELLAALPDFRGVFRGSREAEPVAEAATCAHLLQAGDRAQALRVLAPSTIDSVLRLGDNTLLEVLSEICAATGDRALAERMYERLSPLAGRMVSTGVIGMTWDGPVSRALALVCAVLERPREVDEHFEHALAQLRALRGSPMLAWVACEHAEILATREDVAQQRRARALADEAASIAEQLAMEGIRSRARGCLAQLDERTAAATSPPTSEPENPSVASSFRLSREGDYWRVECAGEVFRLKDIKGLRFLARLVAEPGRDFHVLDLAAPSREAHTDDRGDAGELLDAQARDEYRERVGLLRQEIAEAEAWNDPGRVEKAKAELDFLGAELSRAVGLGGRARRSGSASERARVNVQRRLRDAIARIDDAHPRLGAHLRRSVKTGTYCSYLPE